MNCASLSLRLKFKFVISPSPLHPGFHSKRSCHRRSDSWGFPEKEATQTTACYFYRGERDGGDQQYRWREGPRQAHHWQGRATRISTEGICWYVMTTIDYCSSKKIVFHSCLCRSDEEGVRYVPVRPRPPVTLLRHYRNPWKAAYHHFQRYSDIRVKGQ